MKEMTPTKNTKKVDIKTSNHENSKDLNRVIASRPTIKYIGINFFDTSNSLKMSNSFPSKLVASYRLNCR